MSRRRLSRQQQRRIREARAARAARLHDDGPADGSSLGPKQSGLVVAHHGSFLLVEDAGGQVWRCHQRATSGEAVCGDDCVFQPGDPYGVVVAALPRRSALLRPDPYGAPRAIAANIDRVCIVIAPQPEPHDNLIDRYLVAIELMGAEAVLVVNKHDLGSGLDGLTDPYRALGYPVLEVSAVLGTTETLRAALREHCSVLVGQSGVGKTSLVRALLPDENELRVGALSEGKGRHTTTTARLYRLPGGGALVDSPGIREFGLWHMSGDEVLHGFRELRARLGQCRFRNCTHRNQAGCAIEAAVATGDISQRRYESYWRIVESLGAG